MVNLISTLSILIHKITNCKNNGHHLSLVSVNNNKPSIDIIIPTYKRGLAAINLANLLIQQLQNDDSITIVWQNEEKPPEPFHPSVNIISLPHPNLPEARNAGLYARNNVIVLYLDDDIIPDKGLLNAHRRCYDNPDIGAVAGFIDDPLFTDSNKPSRFDYRTCQLIQNFSCTTSQKTISFMGANMSFKRTALESIDGFNKNFTHNALWEEIDCAFRLLNIGFDIFFCSDAKVKHIRSEKGGCRTDKGACEIYHYFANTTFFSCTYIPLRYFFDWFRFWKNRLEFISRKSDNKNTKTVISHKPAFLLAGLLGIMTGFIRFLLHGKKQSLPDIIKNFGNCL